MIEIAVFDEHRLMLEGITRLLEGDDDLKIVWTSCDREVLVKKLQLIRVHVLVINLHDSSVKNFNLIVQLTIASPKVKILVISPLSGEEIVLKAIKAGAKGFLGAESDRNDLLEAVYTLRNGYDYFSKPITRLLLNRYISNMNNNGAPDEGTGELSSRQIEILRLWGESLTNQEIADRLFISVRTVESHKNHIMQKLNLKSTVDMVKFAIKNNIIEI
ncbi:MAG: LuxR C-terminal-related transcriptional regulator [Mangrovibacterium sp.]